MSHTTTVKSVPIKDTSALHAAVSDLQQKGIRCSLLTNAKPRMYYADQLQRHLGQGNELCPYVLRLEDTAYDIGFLQQKDGSYTPVFDDWVPMHGPFSGKGIKHILGAKFSGKVEHWSGNRNDTEQTLHSIGKFLQGYSKYAAINAASAQGYIIESCTEDSEGNLQLRVTNCQ